MGVKLRVASVALVVGVLSAAVAVVYFPSNEQAPETPVSGAVTATQAKETEQAPETPVSGAIAAAQAKAAAYNVTEKRAQTFSLNCFMAGREVCADLITRAEKNSNLRAVFFQSKAAGVGIVPSGRFYIGEGYVAIDPRASDQEIIKFLTN